MSAFLMVFLYRDIGGVGLLKNFRLMKRLGKKRSDLLMLMEHNWE